MDNDYPLGRLVDTVPHVTSLGTVGSRCCSGTWGTGRWLVLGGHRSPCRFLDVARFLTPVRSGGKNRPRRPVGAERRRRTELGSRCERSGACLRRFPGRTTGCSAARVAMAAGGPVGPPTSDNGSETPAATDLNVCLPTVNSRQVSDRARSGWNHRISVLTTPVGRERMTTGEKFRWCFMQNVR